MYLQTNNEFPENRKSDPGYRESDTNIETIFFNKKSLTIIFEMKIVSNDHILE